jgi:hypothetical protein
MSKYVGEGYTWDWVEMTACGEHRQEGSKYPEHQYNIRWNEKDDVMECKRINPPLGPLQKYEQDTSSFMWTRVVGHNKALTAYKDYMAEMILLENE